MSNADAFDQLTVEEYKTIDAWVKDSRGFEALPILLAKYVDQAIENVQGQGYPEPYKTFFELGMRRVCEDLLIIQQAQVSFTEPDPDDDLDGLI